jgi:adenosine deaminase
MDFRTLPKVELHLHLDCSLSYDVVSRINPAIHRSDFERDFIAPAKCANLADYISRAIHCIALMQTENNLRFVVADLFEQLVRDNALYVEIRFAPLLHTQEGLTPADVVEIVDDAVEKGIERTGVEARLILCTLRHFSVAQSLETVHLVERFSGRRVVALDIAADEAGFPIDAHIPAFQYAINNNIFRTAHAGEARGADSVWETLQHFKPSRIGHGVRSIRDKALIQHLKEARIHLEICPTSNVQITPIESYSDHPVDRFYKSGVSVGINTDARTISNVTLTHEYEVLQRVFGWKAEHFRVCNVNAIEAAFIAKNVKRELTDRLLAAYENL